MNLLELWKAEKQRKSTLKLSLNELSGKLGRRQIRLNRFGEWINGKRQVPPDVLDAMREEMMPEIWRRVKKEPVNLKASTMLALTSGPKVRSGQ